MSRMSSGNHHIDPPIKMDGGDSLNTLRERIRELEKQVESLKEVNEDLLTMMRILQEQLAEMERKGG